MGGVGVCVEDIYKVYDVAPEPEVVSDEKPSKEY